ncbi:hypothetical protein CARUB_v10028655mg [Capsella rubella]|uniref:Transmembrane protein n=1 Tax=Capsella rubella TaxID=81985 RepID=R0F1T0_9BRAS|nr:uncharacterized protein LOC17876402 [Capsella rubella]EOA15256.1 hypothetical protein CARUB_v10028655mg [Capsella rubella]
MVEKSDDEKHFSWRCLLLQLSLLSLLVAFLCFLSSHGFCFSSLLITMAILFISTSVFFLRSFKKKTRVLCSAERSQEEAYDDEYEDEDGLIEIALVSEEAETIEAMRNIDYEDQAEEIGDVNMEEDNLIEIDISIGSIKRRL